MIKTFFAWIVITLFFGTIICSLFFFKQSSSGADPDFSFGITKIDDATVTPNTMSTVATATVPREIPKGYKEYRNEQFGFSVFSPAEIPPKESVDRGPELTVLYQNNEGTEGFQIYAAPIDGTEISQERFLRDEPSGVKKDPINTSVDGVQAVSFHGFDAKMGQTYEVWFIHDHFLYEVSTYKELESGLNEILSTWRFL